MQTIDQYRSTFVSYLEAKIRTREPENLYAPMTYILGLGGKRLRPVLTLMTAEIFGSDPKKALDAALAVEVFHNFSLVHDDIMDAAPLRRGAPTVHQKWDINTGILSGDAMLISAIQYFETYEGEVYRRLLKLFGKTALQVCEGQQYDVDFEERDDVTLSEYIRMIEYKTAVLVAAAMKMGAIIAQAPDASQEAIYDFGRYLGIAFQLQDDYLDAFGDPETFGKQVGGDIIENKKTFLYLRSRELATQVQARELSHLFSIQPSDPLAKIVTVKEIFVESGAASEAVQEMARYTNLAFGVLEGLPITDDKKDLLQKFGERLMTRSR
ncbi:MAG: polyprenyl synthetase family protein [Sediminicola sp.]